MKMLDTLDKKIIRQLSKNGKATPGSIAKQLGVTAPTVRSRIKSLEDSGFLKFVALIDPFCSPVLTTAFIGVNIRSHGNLDEVMDKLDKQDNVLSVSVVTGRYDIIVEVLVEGSNAALYALTSEIIPKLGIVDRTETFVVMAGRKKWVNMANGFESWDGEPTGENDS